MLQRPLFPLLRVIPLQFSLVAEAVAAATVLRPITEAVGAVMVLVALVEQEEVLHLQLVEQAGKIMEVAVEHLAQSLVEMHLRLLVVPAQTEV